MSKITNDHLTQSGCFIAVCIWQQQWASMG